MSVRVLLQPQLTEMSTSMSESVPHLPNQHTSPQPQLLAPLRTETSPLRGDPCLSQPHKPRTKRSFHWRLPNQPQIQILAVTKVLPELPRKGFRVPYISFWTTSPIMPETLHTSPAHSLVQDGPGCPEIQSLPNSQGILGPQI